MKINDAFATTQPKRIALATITTSDYQADLEELKELARTAELEVVHVFTQTRSTPDTSTYFGTGKVQEIKGILKQDGINTIIFNDELTAAQHANLTDELEIEVLDRTNLILHIFSMRARTAEGKIQVELARLKYMLPRLRSIPGELSRQGAGVLARGPGETKLEQDKRYLREEIKKLKDELAEIEKQRATTRVQREKSQLPMIALVGYTNAGKSTLFNRLTDSDVLAENKLFATLDTTIRRTELASGLTVLISDTVGFIRNLPHHLVESFKSTLEETKYADIVLNVCDCSNPRMTEQNNVTHSLLSQLGVNENIIDVYNKADLVDETLFKSNPNAYWISALNGQGIDKLKSILIDKIKQSYLHATLLVPYSKMGMIDDLLSVSFETKTDYIDEGMTLTGYFSKKYMNIWSPFLMRESEK